MWTLDGLLDAHWADYHVTYGDESRDEYDYFAAHSEEEIKRAFKRGCHFVVKNCNYEVVDEVAEEDLVR